MHVELWAVQNSPKKNTLDARTRNILCAIFFCFPFFGQTAIISPSKDGRGFTIPGNLKSFQGLVLKCRGSRKRRAFYLNELVIHEIRNNASAIFQNFLFSCCKIEFVQLWSKSLKPLPSLGGMHVLRLSQKTETELGRMIHVCVIRQKPTSVFDDRTRDFQPRGY
jgi:hypothetical protein